MRHAWTNHLVPVSGDVWVIAAGKASRSMSEFAVEALGHRLKGGIVVMPEAPDLKAGPTTGNATPSVGPTLRSGASLQVFRGGHPLPDEGSLAAGRRALDIAASSREGDTLLVLLSGGASALMACPAEGLSLDDKRDTGARLLAAGADIHAVNTVRKHLSALKGGRLAVAAPATLVTLAISDVVGDDPGVIGSGPTAPDNSTFADALGVLERFGGLAVFRPAVVSHLERGRAGDVPETPRSDHPKLARSAYRVIGNRLDVMRGAAAEAERCGYRVVVRDEPVIGEARESADRLVNELARHLPSATPLCFISSGETTVRVVGSGRGGRNQELALAAAEPLSQLGVEVAGASMGTDGVDGPTDAAGAIVDHTTWARARSLGLDPDAALSRNDSYSVFDALHDLIRTGPTGTNVGDLQVWVTSTGV